MKFIEPRINLVLVLAVLTPLQQVHGKQSIKTDDLSNMVIQGENRLVVHPNVPSKAWNPEPFKETLDILNDHSVAASFNTPALSQPPLVIPTKSMSTKPATPWLNRIFDSPVITLKLKAPQDDRKVDSTFLVKDSAGKVFFDHKASGKVPEEMKWDGFGNSGEPLHVGFDYTHSYLITDEAGNPHRFAGKSFRLDAFRYKKSRDTVIALNPDTVFYDQSSFKLSSDGTDYLTEVKDYVRTHFANAIEIKTFHEDEKFAMSRSMTVKNFLVRALELPEDKVTAAGLPVSDGNYRHVEIILK